jgi:hypothetical protein
MFVGGFSDGEVLCGSGSSSPEVMKHRKMRRE